jgi:hypothetical protein
MHRFRTSLTAAALAAVAVPAPSSADGPVRIVVARRPPPSQLFAECTLTPGVEAHADPAWETLLVEVSAVTSHLASPLWVECTLEELRTGHEYDRVSASSYGGAAAGSASVAVRRDQPIRYCVRAGTTSMSTAQCRVD